MFNYISELARRFGVSLHLYVADGTKQSINWDNIDAVTAVAGGVLGRDSCASPTATTTGATATSATITTLPRTKISPLMLTAW